MHNLILIEACLNDALITPLGVVPVGSGKISNICRHLAAGISDDTLVSAVDGL